MIWIIVAAWFVLALIFILALAKAAANGDRIQRGCPDWCDIPFEHNHVN